jgi:hypothetical protein
MDIIKFQPGLSLFVIVLWLVHVVCLKIFDYLSSIQNEENIADRGLMELMEHIEHVDLMEHLELIKQKYNYN